MSTFTGGNPAAQFVDMATIQASPYAPFLTACDKNSRAFFVRVYEKACPFSQQPQLLSRIAGTAAANQKVRWRLPRTADYVNGLFLQLKMDGLLAAEPSVHQAHRFVNNVKVLFNDMIAEQANQAVFDLAQTFHVPGGQSNAYRTMTNGIDCGFAQVATGLSVIPVGAGGCADLSGAVTGGGGAAYVDVGGGINMFLPLPFWFAQPGNSGAALPVAATPYNDIVIELDTASTFANTVVGTVTATTLSALDLWVNSVVVSNEERSAMACTPRDVLMRQYEHQVLTGFTPAATTAAEINLLFNGAISALYFGARTTTSRSANIIA